jgi:hypothetical protein
MMGSLFFHLVILIISSFTWIHS